MKTPEEMLGRGKGNFINCTDYDDAVQAIKDYHEAKTQWISIKDKLPDKPGEYLVTNGGAILICGLLNNHTFYGITGVTHWMELPKLPK